MPGLAGMARGHGSLEGLVRHLDVGPVFGHARGRQDIGDAGALEARAVSEPDRGDPSAGRPRLMFPGVEN